jgi:4-amino-4-deoxy-L-arabinose transferase-like glycosyltransferase
VAIFLSSEFRLAYLLILQAAILAGAWRFVARRVNGDWADRLADVLLLDFLVQYAGVGIPGLLGILNPLTIAIASLALAAALWFAPTRHPMRAALVNPDEPAIDRWMPLACALFGLGYVAAVTLNQRISPVLANDAITYHFPAAVHWLNSGRLSLFETWFFNPANTYSPLAGSTFIAWWIAPIGNDVVARNVQVPALLLIFFASFRLLRAVGLRSSLAAVIALSILLAKPFVRQSLIEKDDLYLAAFFACAAAGCAGERLRDPLGAWRIGAAVGLMLATKYTALLALPALLLVVDAPFRAGWTLRRFAAAIGLVLLIAGPWYLRNIWLTGNPFYPIEIHVFGARVFPGMFATARSTELSSFGSVWRLLTARDQSLPLWPMIPVLIGCVAAITGRFRALRSEPLIRLCLLGPLVAVGVFVAASPYAEVRFLFPAFLLLYAAAGIAIAHWLKSWSCERLAAAAVILIASWATAWRGEAFRVLGPELVGIATLVLLTGLGVTYLLVRFPERRRVMIQYGSLAAVLALVGTIYVNWDAYVESCRHNAYPAYHFPYGPTADVWKFIRDDLPPDEPLAYSNTYLIHPMSGFEHRRRLVYLPTRRGVQHLHDLPPLPGKYSGENLVPAVAAQLTADTDATGWLQRLKASGAKHLVIFHGGEGVVKTPPEPPIVAANPAAFEVEFNNEAATVWRVR